MWRRRPDTRPVHPSLFARGPVPRTCADRTPATHAARMRAGETFLFLGNQASYAMTRRQDVLVRRADAPVLTITADPYNSIAVVGGAADDWHASFCATGEGDTEGQARASLDGLSIVAAGGTLSIVTPGLDDTDSSRTGSLVVDGPADGAVVIHATNSSVDVRDLSGPVRISALHARARVFGTTGQVDALAEAIDFAGAAGRVVLGAASDVNVQITAARFAGTVRVHAQRAVRVLVPPEFASPIEVVVSRRDRFVCRTDFASAFQHTRQRPLHRFSRAAPGEAPSGGVHLQSEDSVVVIDTALPEG